MSIRVAINHKTEYRYDKPVSLSPHVFRLRPAVHGRTPIESYSLKIKPENHFINWQQDPFGNFLARVVFKEKIKKLSIEVDLIADMTIINPFDFFVEEYAENYPFDYDAQLKKELIPYMELSESGPLLCDWIEKINCNKKSINDFLVDLNKELQKQISYCVRMEPGVQSCEETLRLASGSCRDSGWLLVQIMRHLGLAARFVSGYLIQLTPDEKPLDGPAGTDKDFTDLHAWCEVYVPGAGWLGLDPTSGLFAGEGHIPLACTPDPISAAPVTGLTDECNTEFYFHNEVQRIHEDPRVTKPYTDYQWASISMLGRDIDTELNNNDVRLTMGGEPTFVSIDDMESAQWNTAALGKHKLERAHDLFERLTHQYGSGGLLHYGQGKWYPGEPIPRWALNYFWRKDGTAVWNNRELIAKDHDEIEVSTKDAQKFMHKLSAVLGLSPNYVIPGYEDAVYYLWKEGNLPTNIDPHQHDLKQYDERRKVLEVVESDLNEPRGFVLPVEWREGKNTWRSCQWSFRHKHMYLIPGDSAMGLRLPLDSLPWEKEREIQHEQSLFEALPPLGDFVGEVAQRYSSFESEASEPGELLHEEYADSDQSDHKIIHTAICVEARDNHLYVFLPPLSKLEHYLDLVASVESVAEQLAMPVRIEGYPPPGDWRITKLSVTPDPGVIEVNIHPAHSWEELVENTHILYEQARLARLATEKFMLDGRHTGTGGGNHVTIGGALPKDSPMLRRPDLLRSLVTYWQHHPGLSYMFSGMFIGPTSQAPRIDEAKDESLYELEIAFAQIPEGEVPEPWLVDRLLRNLLVDVTGNTHRAEFCIDKLYSPDSATGRLGIVEFRAFEMPPHAQMSLVQMLLLRNLIAWFWKQPYQHKLVRWGTQLHDRFMLPHYVWADIKDVVNDLQHAGYPFQLEWLAPFLDFRFPRYGTVHIQDIKIELQAAIEPWHVLGEEVTHIGTARYVDSSVERLQIKVTGLMDARYVVTCNKRPVPLHNTGTQGVYVAGVRYRAWQPPSALHPTIGIHAPIVVDIIDTWNGRSIGGCTYHVTHPGGRSYDVFPVNANAAEARRISRFWEFGHTPGMVEVSPVEPNPEFPYTLDLRR